MRIDFHVHTEYSSDGYIKIKDIEEILAEKRIVDAIAITDHDEIDGALALKKIFKDNIIVGEEIDSGEGEITGYWLKERIKPGQGIARTLECIKGQEGIACIPHPFDKLRSKRINSAVLDRFVKGINMIEVFNSRNIFEKANTNARQFAEKNSLLGIAGSDAHYKTEIGNAYVDCAGLENVDRPEKVCDAIKNGKIKGKRCNILYHVKTKLLKIGITTKPR